MSTTRFDRVRPRTADNDAPQSHDVQGKRALFSATSSETATRATRASRGGIDVDCSRCGRTTALAPPALLRLAFPAFHFGVRLRLGEHERMLGLLRRPYPSWLRCPACGHGSWARVTVRL